jgi:membrane protein implicated in regulation of membrane protease activity
MGTMKLKLALAGEKIVIAGLALQVATFVVFLVASVDFQIRMRRKTPTSTLNNNMDDWKKMLRILYAVSTLILFRCTFRLIEYSMGNAGYLTAHEWPLFCFDAVPMFLVLVLLLVLQPTRYVQDTEKKESTSVVLDSSESEVV